MISILSLVTSVKDYIEIVHKLIETDSNFKITNYSDLGPIITYTLITLKEFFIDIISLNWLKSIWDLPVIIPDISSAMISEISVLDGYFHNAFNFLDKPISYGETNIAIYSLEKFSVGLINSLFLCIPTGTTHLITLRRFVMQGLEAGYLAGLGSICGNILWISSIILGWRFFVIPWLSLDIFRYLLGFVLLVKYMWDSYGDASPSIVAGGNRSSGQKKIDITTTSAKQKIFLLNFLLALTEQTSLYPFISNISIGSESSLLESFPAQNYLEFLSIHGSYILGLIIGCFSFLHFTCWFWENPAFKIYMWVISSFKISTTFYYKVLNFTFLYLTMICAISSIPYYGLDYTLTNPLGFVQDDRILDQKQILETSFLNTKASDRNTRRNRGRHGRRERWKRRIRKYRTFDASLYDQGIYDLFTIEDLNYGFDRFWLRRKMRNHRVRFRFFPGPWMRSFKKQLAKPRLESYAGPRQEFFRILFEQVYHPSFHEYTAPTPSTTEGWVKRAKTISTFGVEGKRSSVEGEKNNASVLAIMSSTGSFDVGGTPMLIGQGPKINQNLFSLLPKKDFSIYSTSPSKFISIASFDLPSTPLVEKVDNKNKKEAVSNLNNRRLGVEGNSKSKLSNDINSSSNILIPEESLSRFAIDRQSNKKNTSDTLQPMLINSIVQTKFNTKENLKIENSTLRKFVRKINNRLKNAEIKSNLAQPSTSYAVEGWVYDGFKKQKKVSGDILSNKYNRKDTDLQHHKTTNNSLYSKRWKEIFSKISHDKEQVTATNGQLKGFLKKFYQTSLTDNKKSIMFRINMLRINITNFLFPFGKGAHTFGTSNFPFSFANNKAASFSSYTFGGEGVGEKKKENSKINLSKQDKQILKYRSILASTPTPSLFVYGAHTQNNNVVLDKKTKVYNTSFSLLHPLKFYLKKQEAFERKLRYYTPTIFRKFSIENNAPYFRVMMKRYFYYFKPTLRWERTMKVASLRKARRKTPVSARKIQFSASSDLIYNKKSIEGEGLPSTLPRFALSTQPSTAQLVEGVEAFNLSEKSSYAVEDKFKEVRKTKATHNYTIVGKRASRFRYEIYKDVLQHWYYSPFNRLLLKFDIDLFIKRQPNSHFLTKNEEKLLHLRRFLLSEHYNTLRWYSYMQHYRSMKTKIGGTKSFASKVYNQQFSGTFKKIRHLFAITPSQSNQSVLKFDQPLYNESFNNSKNNLQKNLIIHEELLNDNTKFEDKSLSELELGWKALKSDLPSLAFSTQPSTAQLVEGVGEGVRDLLNQSTQIVRTYLKNSNPIKQQYIKNLIEDKNYLKLTQFLYKGQKTRGLKPITNESSLLNQEKEYLLTNVEKEEFKNLEKIKLNKMLRPLQQDLWINLLKRWKRKINDQEFLKNYLQRRIEKREKRKQKKEINLKTKLERLESWLGISSSTPTVNGLPSTQNVGQPSPTEGVRSIGLSNLNENQKSYTDLNVSLTSGEITTGINNALIEGVSTLKNHDSPSLLQGRLKKGKSYSQLKKASFLKKEKELSYSLKNLTKIIKELNQTKPVISTSSLAAWGQGLPQTSKTMKEQPRTSVKVLGVAAKIKNIYKTYKYNSSKLILYNCRKLINIFKPIIQYASIYKKKKNLKNWQKRERSLNKQKRSRKEFKLFSSAKHKNQTSLKRQAEQNYFKYLDQLTRSVSPLNFSRVPHALDQSNGPISNLTSIESASVRERKKRDFSTDLLSNAVNNNTFSTQPSVVEGVGRNIKETSTTEKKSNWKNIVKETYVKYFGQLFTEGKRSMQPKFKRKKSPQRRARIRRNRGVTKKRTLSDSLKREFKNLRKYGEKMDDSNNKVDGRKQKIYLSFNSSAFFDKSYSPSVKGKELSVDGIFKQSPLQRRSKQKKQRFWKQKRSKYSQKLRKYKKRRRSVLGKVRILNKQLKRIQSTTELKNWWWKNFLPNLRATTDSLLQFEKDRQIQQKLLELTIPEILERDKFNNIASPNLEGFSNVSGGTTLNSSPLHDLQTLNSMGDANKTTDMLQIGDFDFKPLSMPEAIRIREKNMILPYLITEGKQSEKEKHMVNKQSMSNGQQSSSLDSQASLLVPEVPTELLPNKIDNTNQLQPKVYSTNIVPFYAGWDESLRKFVVTNRLLSRRSSGYEMRTNQFVANQRSADLKSVDVNQTTALVQKDQPYNKKINILSQSEKEGSPLLRDNLKSFSEAPLKGMNAATTLYWQIPFTTYDPDQFFALGMDGFAPLGWRRFQFRHSILKSWLTGRGESVRSPDTFGGKDGVDKGISNLPSFSVLPNRRLLKVNNNVVDKKKPQALNSTEKKEGNKKKDSLSKEENQHQNTYIAKNKTNILDRIYGQNFQFTFGKGDTILQNNVFNAPQKNALAHGPTGIQFSDISITTFGVEGKRSPFNKNVTVKNIYRRLKKRYKRVKKHPRSPVWFPSGPLLNQVLPVHYIYIFYKRSRLPRDRYIKRRLRKSKLMGKDASHSAVQQNDTVYTGPISRLMPTKDFTLRKRIKTKRKYHIKQDLSKKLPLIPRRMKFILPDFTFYFTQPSVVEAVLPSVKEGNSKSKEKGIELLKTNYLRWRPLSRQKINKPIAELIKEQRALKYKQRKKDEAALTGNNKQTSNLRVKQLRRRVQRQIIRSVWRYRPRAGGFVWPGDYLKLEQVKAPKLNSSVLNTNFDSRQNTMNTDLKSASIKIKRKKKRNIQEWQIQPKKYLLEKHNLNAIKKKLEKANRSNKIRERIKEFNLTLLA